MKYFEVGKLYHADNVASNRTPIMVLEVFPTLRYQNRSAYAHEYECCTVLWPTGECGTLDLYLGGSGWKKL